MTFYLFSIFAAAAMRHLGVTGVRFELAPTSDSVSLFRHCRVKPGNDEGRGVGVRLNRTVVAGACPWSGLQLDPGAAHDGEGKVRIQMVAKC